MSAVLAPRGSADLPGTHGVHRRAGGAAWGWAAALRNVLAGRRVQPADGLLPLSLVLWLVGVSEIEPAAMNDYGLLPALPLIFFAGLVLLVVSISTLLVRPRLSPLRLALHLVALVLVLHGTIPLLFAEPNFPWVYKHIGVVGYINEHGRLDTHVDIYHNWPGFFALAAWFTRVAGVGTPLAYAAWASVYFNLLTCLMLAFAFRWLPISRRARWLSLFLFVGANWVGQDYFAPQAMAFVLSLATFGMVLAWFQVDRPPALVRLGRRLALRLVRTQRGASVEDEREEVPSASPRRVTSLLVLFAVFAVIVVTHQLSPYVIILGVGLLTLAGVVRPRWLVAGFVVLSGAYLVLRLPYLQRTQDLFGSVGDPLNNIHNRAPSDSVAMKGRQVTALAAPALILGMWLLGALGVVRRLWAGRSVLLLVILGASPALVAVGQSYGGEAVFRIYLFSLPWVAVLAASALEPRSDRRPLWAAGRIGLVLAVIVGLFITVFYGAEELYRVRAGEIAASRHFYDQAEPGSVLTLAAPNFPTRVGARYDQFRSGGDNLPSLLATVKDFQHRMLGEDDLPAIGDFVDEYVTGATAPGGRYLVLSTGQEVFAEVLGLTPPGSLANLDRALAASPSWEVFYRNQDAVIYRSLTPSVVRSPPAAPAAVPASRPQEGSLDPVGVGTGVLGMAAVLVGWRRRRNMAGQEEPVVHEKEMMMQAAPVTNGGVFDAAAEERGSPASEMGEPTGSIEDLVREALLQPEADSERLRWALSTRAREPGRFREVVAAVPPAQRPEAITLLGQAWHPVPLEDIGTLLHDPSGRVREAALAVLDLSPEAIVEVGKLLRDDLSSAVRVAALRALAQAPEADQLWALSVGLADPEPQVRTWALGALPVAGAPRAMRSVLAACEDDDIRVRRAAYHRLAQAEPWILWMAIDRSSRREELCEVLQHQALHDRLGALVLERASSPEPGDRVLAMELASRLDTPGWHEESIHALRDPEVAVRQAAVRLLRARPEAVPALVSTLRDDPDSVVRTEAAGALDSVEMDDALLALVGALQDPEEEVRRIATEALVRNTSPGLAQRIADGLSTANSGSVGQVLERMGAIGAEALLATAFSGPRDRAVAAAGLLRRGGRVPALLACLKAVEPATRARTVEVLGALGGPEAQEGLIIALSDAWPGIRRRAAFHLGQVGDDDARAPLLRTSERDPAPEVLRAAGEALRQMEARAEWGRRNGHGPSAGAHGHGALPAGVEVDHR